MLTENISSPAATETFCAVQQTAERGGAQYRPGQSIGAADSAAG